MVVEIAGGWMFNSMALLADGWHMSSHALALSLSALACAAARRFARDTRFAFGTWKIEIPGGYTCAVFLVGVASVMLFQSVERLIFPMEILNQHFAYPHAIADAATSALSITAMASGKFWNSGWLDPIMGIVGAALVALWACGLPRDTGRFGKRSIITQAVSGAKAEMAGFFRALAPRRKRPFR
jgi:Co/Zn/Cd efflux system component